MYASKFTDDFAPPIASSMAGKIWSPFWSSSTLLPSTGSGSPSACAEPKNSGALTLNVCSGRYSATCRRPKK